MAAISSQLNLDASAQRFKRKALGKTAGVSCRHLNASGRKMHKMMCAALEDSRPEWVRYGEDIRMYSCKNIGRDSKELDANELHLIPY